MQCVANTSGCERDGAIRVRVWHLFMAVFCFVPKQPVVLQSAWTLHLERQANLFEKLNVADLVWHVGLRVACQAHVAHCDRSHSVKLGRIPSSASVCACASVNLRGQIRVCVRVCPCVCVMMSSPVSMQRHHL